MQGLKVWEDVLDETLDMQVAPELGEVSLTKLSIKYNHKIECGA